MTPGVDAGEVAVRGAVEDDPLAVVAQGAARGGALVAPLDEGLGGEGARRLGTAGQQRCGEGHAPPALVDLWVPPVGDHLGGGRRLAGVEAVYVLERSEEVRVDGEAGGEVGGHR